MLRAQGLAALLAGLALALGLLGLNADMAFGTLFVSLAATAAVGWVGLVHQIGASCLLSAASGDAEPLPLSDRLMEDYLRPGLLVALLLGTFGWLAVRGAEALVRMHATMLTMMLYWGPIAAYFTVAYTLAASNRSVLGYLDVAHVLAIVRRAPLPTLVIVVLGATPLVGTIAGIAACFDVASSARSWMTVALNLGVLAPLAALGLGYVLGTIGAAMGLLLSTKALDR
jgi:hypothetical protein